MSLTQQKRLYSAERCLWGHGREFSSNSEVIQYLQGVTESDWFVQKYGWLPPIQVGTMRSEKWAGCADRHQYVIYLKRRYENIVLHELAHLLCSTDEHDEEFTSIFLHLIRNSMGFYAWAEFIHNLEKENYYGS